MLRINRIGSQLLSFLWECFAKSRPEQIVTVERKGTAILRTLFNEQLPSSNFQISWDRIFTSYAVKRSKKKLLPDRRTLIIEDTVRTGKNLQEVLELVTNKQGVPAHMVRLATFAVHEDCQFKNLDHYWFGALGDRRFEEVRGDIIDFLQQHGSLLLDTEHVEIEVQLQCGRLEFLDALCQAGIGVEHISGGDRVNLTVHNPILLDESQFLSSLPRDCSTRDVIRKIRVVERDTDRFSLIPIFFPSPPVNDTDFESWELPRFLKDLRAEGVSQFHVLGIYASVYLFSTIFACLRKLINENKVKVHVPEAGEADDALSHLKALFPPIDIVKLREFLQERIDIGCKWKARRSELHKPIRIEANEATGSGKELRTLYQFMLINVLRLTEDLPHHSHGATLNDLLRILRRKYNDDESRMRQEALLSATLDRAIDGGDLLTGVVALPFSDKKKRLTRSFCLDGEVVTGRVRRLSVDLNGAF